MNMLKLVMTENRKRVALITVYRIVNSQTSGLDSNKAQHQRGIGRVLSTKISRMKQLKELTACIKNCTATHVIAAGDFN